MKRKLLSETLFNNNLACIVNMFDSDNNIKSKKFDMPNAVIVLKRIKLITCNKCTSVFIKQSEYKLHKLKHDLQNIQKERKEKNKTYYKKTNTVGYEKKIKCDECDMKFVEKSTLELHSALHKPFPHVCDCGVGFYDKEDLKCHIKIVHDEGKAIEPSSKKPKNMIILGSKKSMDSWNTHKSEI